MHGPRLIRASKAATLYISQDPTHNLSPFQTLGIYELAPVCVSRGVSYALSHHFTSATQCLPSRELSLFITAPSAHLSVLP